MNFVFLSPHFPPNYGLFCVHLNQLGVSVLGLADEPYDLLSPELKEALSEYYQVGDMHNYDELVRAMGYFTHHYGKIDRIDSQNEYWLETEAQLRTDFNVPGFQVDDIQWVKRKSWMKKMFEKAGVETARGALAHSPAQAKKLVKQTGYPLVAKPDIGVGAARTVKISNDAELDRFFKQKPAVDYILEEFVTGEIYTFDGLVDQQGNLVFYTSHKYSQGIMETVNDDSDIYYYSLRDIPPELEDAGRRVLKAYDLRERFFHFEFFRQPNNRIVALEVNMRPPGGLTTDMFNYANDIDIYHEWAHIIVHNRFTVDYSRPFHCCYVGRKNHRRYQFDHFAVLDNFGEQLVHHQPISGIFSAALGDYGYLFRTPNLETVHEIAHEILKLA